jgi:hypothetical protein
VGVTIQTLSRHAPFIEREARDFQFLEPGAGVLGVKNFLGVELKRGRKRLLIFTCKYLPSTINTVLKGF